MTSLLAPTSLDNKGIGIPSSNRNFTQRSLNSNPYRFPYRLSFPLPFFLTSSTSSMGTLLSPSQECHPFTTSSLAHDLVVSAGEDRPVVRSQDSGLDRSGQGSAQTALGHDAEGALHPITD